MDAPLLDLNFLIEISDNDNNYIHDVILLFLESVPPKLSELGQAVKETGKFESIQKQAHFLKSSANIIKIRGLYEGLSTIESLAKQKIKQDEICKLTATLLANFEQALPLLLEAEKKYDKKK